MNAAEDIMTRDIVSISGDRSVAEAIALMRAHDISCLIVDRPSSAGTWGILSRTDIIRNVIAKGKNIAEVKVAEIMSKPVTYVRPNATLQEIAMLMRRENVRRVIVYDGKQIVGIVGVTDLFDTLNQAHEVRSDENMPN